MNKRIKSGWTTNTLEELSERVIVGLATSVTPYYRATGIPLLRNQNIRPNKLDSSEVLYIDSKFADSNKIKAIKPNDILTVRSGANVGQSCLVTEAFEGALTFTTLITTTKADRLFPQFLCQHINSDLGIKEVMRLTGSTGIGNLNAGQFVNYTLDVPPLPEQEKIASILSAWDLAIDQTERLIAAKTRFKLGLTQQLLTGKKRFKEFEGQKWREARIGEFLKESRMEGSNGAMAKKITVKLYGKGVIGKRDRIQGSTNTNYYIRKSGQFIYSKLDFLNGAFGIIPKDLDGFESTLDLPAFDIGNGLHPDWLLYTVTQERFYRNCKNAAEGGRKACRVQPDEFLKTKVLFPSREEQHCIAEVLNTFNKEIEYLQQQLDALKKQKRGLMQKLLTGQIRIKVDESVRQEGARV